MSTTIDEKLRELGLRLEGDFTLKSKLTSRVKWDIEKLFEYPKWVRIEVLRPWIFSIGILKSRVLVGIPTGGLLLADDIGECLGTTVLDAKRTYLGDLGNRLLVDDVITTGNTIRAYLTSRVKAIAVLVNRSGLSDINGIPIVTGIFADRV